MRVGAGLTRLKEHGDLRLSLRCYGTTTPGELTSGRDHATILLVFYIILNIGTLTYFIYTKRVKFNQILFYSSFTMLSLVIVEMS